MSTQEHTESTKRRRCVRLIVTVGVVAAVGCAASVLWIRLDPHLITVPERRVSSKRPVLIINPGSGSGMPAKIDLAGTVAAIGFLPCMDGSAVPG